MLKKSLIILSVVILSILLSSSIFDMQEIFADSKSVKITKSLLGMMEYTKDTIPNFPIPTIITIYDAILVEPHSKKIIDFIQKNDVTIDKIDKGKIIL